MSEITFKGNTIHTTGSLPPLNQQAPHFTLTKSDLSELSSEDMKGNKVILNIFVSLDTPVCANSVRKFNETASKFFNTKVICVSADLPFAAKRFCETEGLNNVITASTFRHPEFAKNYGVLIEDGPLEGLLARAIVVLDEEGKATYAQLVNEITQEPDYEAALKVIKE